jgi:hypothetical protein
VAVRSLAGPAWDAAGRAIAGSCRLAVRLAYVGWISHPLLDLLNTYGIRLLMPFSERWFYGDTLFIIDVWLWTALSLGAWLSGRRWRKGTARAGRPALVSLVVAALYTTAMGASSLAAERLTREAAEARGHGPIRTVVASPVPVDPFRRAVVFATDEAYGFGVLRWTPRPELQLDPRLTSKNMDDPAVAEARKVKQMADFLYWSRLPFATIERRADATVVTVGDARYSNTAAAGQFVRTVRLPPGARRISRSARPIAHSPTASKARAPLDRSGRPAWQARASGDRAFRPAGRARGRTRHPMPADASRARLSASAMPPRPERGHRQFVERHRNEPRIAPEAGNLASRDHQRDQIRASVQCAHRHRLVGALAARQQTAARQRLSSAADSPRSGARGAPGRALPHVKSIVSEG